jgi:hypothetical protein
VQLEDWGVDLPAWEEEQEFSEEDFGADFTLPSGEKDKFGVMNFTVTDEQRDRILMALDVAVLCEGYTEEDNKNKNGAGLDLIVKEWMNGKLSDLDEDDEDTLKGNVEELREYLCRALHKSGHTASDVDKLLGTNGMSGHYFGKSQWMFPTREAYEKMKEIMDLPRDFIECAKIVTKYNYIKKIKSYGSL